MTCTECPHCGREFNNAGNLASHAPACLRNPAVRERVAAALTDPDRAGWARGRNDYALAAAALGAPSYTSLLVHYGSFAAACADFGLQAAPTGRPRKDGTRPPIHGRRERCEEAAMAETEEALERDAELRAYWRDGRGWEVCRVRELADGRVACELR